MFINRDHCINQNCTQIIIISPSVWIFFKKSKINIDPGGGGASLNVHWIVSGSRIITLHVLCCPSGCRCLLVGGLSQSFHQFATPIQQLLFWPKLSCQSWEGYSRCHLRLEGFMYTLQYFELIWKINIHQEQKSSWTENNLDCQWICCDAEKIENLCT